MSGDDQERGRAFHAHCCAACIPNCPSSTGRRPRLPLRSSAVAAGGHKARRTNPYPPACALCRRHRLPPSAHGDAALTPMVAAGTSAYHAPVEPQDQPSGPMPPLAFRRCTQANQVRIQAGPSEGQAGGNAADLRGSPRGAAASAVDSEPSAQLYSRELRAARGYRQAGHSDQPRTRPGPCPSWRRRRVLPGGGGAAVPLPPADQAQPSSLAANLL